MSAPEPAPPHDQRCLACGAPLSEDQEWCLECGAARRVIRRAPDWRVPVLVIGLVVALVLAAFVVVVISLSSAGTH